MFWQFLGVLASALTIFMFVTGITSLSQLRRGWPAKFHFAPSLKALPAPPTDYSVITMPLSYLFLVLLVGAIAMIIVLNLPRPTLPNWAPAVMSSESSWDRAWFAGLETVGFGYILLVCVLRRKGWFSGELGLLLMFPIIGAVLGLASGFSDMSKSGVMPLTECVVFTGILSALSFAFITFVEALAAITSFLADRWRA